jgi:predicted extracellular nuclease
MRSGVIRWIGLGRWFPFGCGLFLAACAMDGGPSPSLATRSSAVTVNPSLVISQLFGGGGNASAVFQNDFVELFNRGAATVALDGLSVQYASATGTASFSGNRVSLTGSLAVGQHYLIQLAAGTGAAAALPAPDLASASINLSATAGKVALVSGTAGLACNGGSTPCGDAALASIIDLVGYGNASFFEGSAAAPTLSNTSAGLRLGDGCNDTNDNRADFATGAPQPRNTAAPATPCGPVLPPVVVATAPAAGATGVGLTAAISVSFSQPVAASGAWFAITCSSSGAVTAAPSGGPVAFTLTPAAPLSPSETCVVTVTGAAVRELEAQLPMSADFTFSFTTAAPLVPMAIHDIQGAAHISPQNGNTVATHGIVTALRSNGFYLQDPAPDTDDATSEAIFVFTAAAPAASVGDAVAVTGVVDEFRPGCTPTCAASDSDFANLTTTELSGPAVTVLSSGNPLPPPIVIGAGPGARTPPVTIIDDDSLGDVEAAGGVFDPANDGIDFYESLEGMRVQINDAVAVEPTRTDSNGALELAVLADGGAASAGARSARGGIVIAAGAFNPQRIFVTSPSLPGASVADTFPGAIVGVMDYSFGNFKVVASDPLPALVAGGLTPETFALPAAGPADLSVGSMNMENLSPTDPPEKFQGLARVIIENLQAPDILTASEIQDSSGPTSNGVVEASLTFNTLVAAISAAGGPSYDFRAIDPANGQDGGQPGGNIRVGFLFRVDRGVAFVDRPGGDTSTADAVLDAGGGAAQLAFSPGRIDPTNPAFANSRKPLAGEFTFAGARLFVIANHFNAKLGDDPLFGRFQPPVLSSAPQRIQQAQIVADFVARILAVEPAARVLVAGDLNDFEFSPPLGVLKGAGLADLVETLPANRRYSFNFDGNAEVLDHILVSASQRADLLGYDIVHVNSELLVQVSDHDPEVARFRIDVTPPVLQLPPALTAEATGAAGAAVSFNVSAADNLDGALPVSCAPASGATFPPGVDLVSCSAVDAHGNTARGTFTVTVRDTTAPVFSRVPALVAAFATSTAGAVVAYATPVATDAVDGGRTVSCAPASRATFPPGVTAVDCVAVDAAGNAAHAGFSVRVTYAAPTGGSFFLPPINPDGSSLFVLGSTVPVRFALGGASARIANLAAHVSLTKVSDRLTGTRPEALLRLAPDSGSTFRFEPRDREYAFNLSTGGLGAGTWSVRADLGDGVSHAVLFSLRP